MSRFNSSGSYHHYVRREGRADYEIGWTVDRYVKGSRLRFPTAARRWTDEAGARRFCRRWGLEMPSSPHAT